LSAWEGNDGLRRQLRRQQLIDGDQPPFRLSADVRYSLLLEEYPEQWGSGRGLPVVGGCQAETPPDRLLRSQH